MPLEALIFDVDGTLAETEELHRRAFNETFAAERIAEYWPDPDRRWFWSRHDYAKLLRVTGGRERIAHYIRDWLGAKPDDQAIAELHRLKSERYRALIGDGALTLRPGAADLIAQAQAAGLRLAIATATSRPNVEALIETAFGGRNPFDAWATGDAVARKKPAPDVHHLALTALGLPPNRCVAIEDSAPGVQAAKAAGLRCAAAPGAYGDDDDLSAADLIAARNGPLPQLSELRAIP